MKHNNIYLGLVTPSSGWWSPIKYDFLCSFRLKKLLLIWYSSFMKNLFKCMKPASLKKANTIYKTLLSYFYSNHIVQNKHQRFCENCQNQYCDVTRQTNHTMKVPWWYWNRNGNDTWCFVDTKWYQPMPGLLGIVE